MKLFIISLVFVSCLSTETNNTGYVDTLKYQEDSRFIDSFIQSRRPRTDSLKLIDTEMVNVLPVWEQLEDNIKFISDSILKGNRYVLKNYLKRYQNDTCGWIAYDNSHLKSDFEGLRILEDINGDNKKEKVIILPAFNFCDEGGESYCFFDSSLPRLYTESRCCHPENLFVVGDIDEDGIKEIGIYYSSCASRYKALLIYSLKDNDWKLIGRSTFDILTQDPDKVSFASLVKKLRKGEFKICSFKDGKTEWEIFKM